MVPLFIIQYLMCPSKLHYIGLHCQCWNNSCLRSTLNVPLESRFHMCGLLLSLCGSCMFLTRCMSFCLCARVWMWDGNIDEDNLSQIVVLSSATNEHNVFTPAWIKCHPLSTVSYVIMWLFLLKWQQYENLFEKTTFKCCQIKKIPL